MSLPPETISQLVRQAFSPKRSSRSACQPDDSADDKSGAIQLELDDRRAQIRRLQDRLENIDGVRVTAHPTDRDPRSRALLRFMIPDPTEPKHYFRTDELRLESNASGQLVLNANTNKATSLHVLVSDFDQIVELVHLVHKQYAQQRAAIAKQRLIDRMRDLAQAQQASANQ